MAEGGNWRVHVSIISRSRETKQAYTSVNNFKFKGVAEREIAPVESAPMAGRSQATEPYRAELPYNL